MPDALAADDTRTFRARTFAALAESADYRRYYLGQGVSLIGTWLQTAAVSWIVFDMTRSEWWLGVVDAAGTMPGLFVGLLAGALADRVVPRTMILTMQVGQMLLAFLLALLVGWDVVRIWQLAAILAATRVCVTFEMPSRQVFLYELVGRSSLMNAIALNSGLFNASRVIGPALAGICLARLGRTACFAANGASYLAAIAALLTIRTRSYPLPSPEARGLSGLLGGLAYLRRDRRVGMLYLLMAFLGVVGMGYAALAPAYAQRVVHTEELGFSLLLACGGLGATVGALAIASLGHLRRKDLLVVGGMGVFAAFLLAAGTVPPALVQLTPGPIPLAVAAVCLFGTGFGAIVFFASVQTLIQTAVPDELRGRVMGIWMIVYSGSVPLGSLWAGRVAQAWGVPFVMQISALACLGVAALTAGSGILNRPRR